MGGDGTTLGQSDVPKVAELLGLSAEQRSAAASLIEAYQTERRGVARSMREAMSRARSEMIDPEDFAAIGAKIGDLTVKASAERERLRGQLIEDLRSLLAPDQAERWAGFERFLRKRELLPRGVLAGENVDLERCVEEVLSGTDRPRGLVRALAEYDLELDAALRAREVERAKADGTLPGGEAADIGAIRELMRKHREIGVPVRDVNLRYARILEDAMPEGLRSDFAKVVKSRMHPRVYGKSHAERSMEAALGMKDLTADQRERVERLLAAYRSDAEGLNERWAAAIAEQEKTGGGGTMLDFVSETPGRPDTADGATVSPVRAARRARREADRSALKGLREVLTPEQAEKLPSPTPAGPSFGGGDGGEGMIVVPMLGDGAEVEVESVEVDGGGGLIIRRTVTTGTGEDE